MPFRSQAQRRLFYAKASRGEMPRSTVRRWERHTPKGPLPEKVASAAGVYGGFLDELAKLAAERIFYGTPSGVIYPTSGSSGTVDAAIRRAKEYSKALPKPKPAHWKERVFKGVKLREIPIRGIRAG